MTQFEAVVIKSAFLMQSCVDDTDAVDDTKLQPTVVFEYRPRFAIVKSSLLLEVQLPIVGHRVKIEIGHRKQLAAIDDTLSKCNR